MNTSTYAKLTKPPQFRADESVTFRLEFSNDLACTYGTLKIYGYSFNVLDGKRYEGIKVTQYINTFVLFYFLFPFNISSFSKSIISFSLY